MTTRTGDAPGGLRHPAAPSASTGGEDHDGLVERIAAAASGCSHVAGLTAGPRARVVTYRTGRPFLGVAVRDGEVEVGVVARLGRPFPETAEDVRRAVRPLVGDRPVHVLIGDIADQEPEGGAR